MKERGLLTYKKSHLCIPYGIHYPGLSKYASHGAYPELLQFLFAAMFPIFPKISRVILSCYQQFKNSIK
jgi:hypothetical protein